MNANHQCCYESRSSRFNLSVHHPSKWRILLEALWSSPLRLHRYRDLSRRMVEDTLRAKESGSGK